MSITFLPKSVPGKRAIILLVVSIVLFAVATLTPGLERAGDLPSFTESPVFAVLMYSGIILAILAFIFALTSILKHHERSILIFLAILPGLLFSVGSMVMLVALVIQLFMS